VSRGLVIAVLLALAAPLHAEPVAEARDHFERGARAYELGDYRRAIAEYRASYELAPRALLLYDLGQAYRKLGELERALQAYRQYLARSPSGRYRDAAAAQARELEQLIEAQRKLAAAPPDDAAVEPERPPPPALAPTLIPVPPVTADRPARRRASLIAAIALGAAGLLSAATATGLAVHADALAGRTPSSLRDEDALVSEVGRERGAAWGLFAVAGAALAGSAINVALWRHDRVSVAVAPHPAGIVAALRMGP
jgi:tetratricopeptide (TPR) repeat protein